MKQVLDNIPTPVIAVSLGPDPRALVVNRQFVRTFGYTLEDIPGPEDWFIRAYPDERARDANRAWWRAAVITATASPGKVETTEVQVTCKDGTLRDVLANLTIIGTMMVVTLADITERKRMEERLRISEERHRLLAENARDVVWTMAVDGTVTYVSPSVESVRGITPEEAMRQPIEEIHTPQSAAISIGYFTKLHADLQAGRPPERFRGELEYRRRDGSTFWTDVMVYPIVGPDGAVVEILGVTRDIGDRKRAEEASRLAALGTLVAGVAHEINNPLNGVMASDAYAREEVERLRNELRAGPPADAQAMARELDTVAEALRDSQHGAERIARIVKDLAVLGRPDADRARVRPGELIRQAMRWLPEAVASGAEIRVEEGTAPEVLVSQGQIVQAILHLVTNAVRSMLPGRRGVVTVRSGPGCPGMARIEVSDDGVGIPDEALDRIFDPFFTTRPAGEGMGLGLSICRAVAVAHGGTLSVESTLGKGATFRLELPAAPGGA